MNVYRHVRLNCCARRSTERTASSVTRMRGCSRALSSPLSSKGARGAFDLGAAGGIRTPNLLIRSVCRRGVILLVIAVDLGIYLATLRVVALAFAAEWGQIAATPHSSQLATSSPQGLVMRGCARRCVPSLTCMLVTAQASRELILYLGVPRRLRRMSSARVTLPMKWRYGMDPAASRLAW